MKRAECLASVCLFKGAFSLCIVVTCVVCVFEDSKGIHKVLALRLGSLDLHFIFGYNSIEGLLVLRRLFVCIVGRFAPRPQTSANKHLLHKFPAKRPNFQPSTLCLPLLRCRFFCDLGDQG